MKVLLLGSGGRESALAAALARSRRVTHLLVAPGNPGIAAFAETVDVHVTGPASVTRLASSFGADLVVVGPEAPLVAGIGDSLRHAGFKVFGPNRVAARIEGSKSYAKKLMDQAGIPTARWRSFRSANAAVDYMDSLGPPYVVKADGLAAGKGVVVTEDRAEAVDAIEARLMRGEFGDAGETVVIEDFLDGEEASLIALTDGTTVLPCEIAQDYKRAYDGDKGPNTGGMGSYSPVPACPPELGETIMQSIVTPMIRQTTHIDTPYVGALYAGLALTSRGPRVVEFNVRFGDPETQALIPRLRSDFGELCMAAASGELAGMKLEWSREACVSVVLASAGYPGAHEIGFPIFGIDKAAAHERVHVFHAGTARRDSELVTAGGRVLAVSALGNGFADARERAYQAASLIDFEGKHLRSDIALRAERAEESGGT